MRTAIARSPAQLWRAPGGGLRPLPPPIARSGFGRASTENIDWRAWSRLLAGRRGTPDLGCDRSLIGALRGWPQGCLGHG